MSAWDVAGAVVWTPLALAHWTAAFTYPLTPRWSLAKVAFLTFTVGSTLAAVFCIARLFGAHA